MYLEHTKYKNKKIKCVRAGYSGAFCFDFMIYGKHGVSLIICIEFLIDKFISNNFRSIREKCVFNIESGKCISAHLHIHTLSSAIECTFFILFHMKNERKNKKQQNVIKKKFASLLWTNISSTFRLITISYIYTIWREKKIICEWTQAKQYFEKKKNLKPLG